MLTESTTETKDTKSSASAAVLETLEEYDDVDLCSQNETLYDFVDPDALDALFGNEQGTNLSIQFDVNDVTVTLWEADGEIQARSKVHPQSVIPE